MARLGRRSRRFRWRSTWTKLLLSAAGAGIALLLVEIALRLAVPAGPFAASLDRLGFEPTWLCDVPYRHAPCPECDPARSEEHLVGPTPDPSREDEALRIVVVGDSMSVGYGLDHEQTWPAQVADRLRSEFSPRPVHLYNLAVGGYELGEAAASFRHWGRSYRPHLVIYAFFVNDLSHLKLLGHYGEEDVLVSFLPFQGGVGIASLLPRSVRLSLFRSVYLYQWLTPRAHGLLLHVGDRQALLAGDMDEKGAADEFQGLAREIRSANAIPLVALLPPATWTRCIKAIDDETCDTHEAKLARAGDMARREGMLLADFRDEMGAHPHFDYTNHAIAPEDDDHYGPQAHVELASFLTDELHEQGILAELGALVEER